MSQVTMLVNTFFKKPLKFGDIVEVTEDVAARWEKNGIAKRVEKKTTTEKKPKGGKKNDA